MVIFQLFAQQKTFMNYSRLAGGEPPSSCLFFKIGLLELSLPEDQRTDINRTNHFTFTLHKYLINNANFQMKNRNTHQNG